MNYLRHFRRNVELMRVLLLFAQRLSHVVYFINNMSCFLFFLTTANVKGCAKSFGETVYFITKLNASTWFCSLIQNWELGETFKDKPLKKKYLNRFTEVLFLSATLQVFKISLTISTGNRKERERWPSCQDPRPAPDDPTAPQRCLGALDLNVIKSVTLPTTPTTPTNSQPLLLYWNCPKQNSGMK